MMKNKINLVLLGTGFAAFTLLKKIDYKKFNVNVISPRNHFLFTPLLPSTTVGSVELRSIIEPIRIIKKNFNFVQAYAKKLIKEKKELICTNALDNKEFSISYDLLIIAVGAQSATYNIKGVKEHALFLEELWDARQIRQKIIDNFERASTPNLNEDEIKKLLSFIIVGGGPTGVEFAAELSDFLEEDLSKIYPSIAKYASIQLFEAGNKILSTFDKKLSDYAMKHFERINVIVSLNSLVQEVQKDKIILKDGKEIPYGLLVWSTGNTSTDFVKELDFEKDKFGRLITKENFLIKGETSIFAIGDCSTIEGMDMPATAQVAMQSGKFLANLLNNKDYLNNDSKKFKYKHLGMLAYIGNNKALADLSYAKTGGFSSWIFWRTAYLTRLVSLKNKILVLFDWIKTGIFGRDVSRF